MSHLIPGVVAIVAGVVAYLALGRRDPVKSVFDYSDERGTSLATPGAASAGPEVPPGA